MNRLFHSTKHSEGYFRKKGKRTVVKVASRGKGQNHPANCTMRVSGVNVPPMFIFPMKKPEKNP